jgi:hypothetical protein
VGRLVPIILGLSLLAAACGGEPSTPPGATSSAPGALQFAAQMATEDLYAAAPQRAQIGVFASDSDEGARSLSFGTLDVAFSYLGEDGGATPEAGPTATARYIPAYGFPEGGEAPELTPYSDSRGVYQADVTFDRAGIWRADVSFATAEQGAQELATTFVVVQDPAYPAPGDRAPRTQNLTLDDEGEVPASAIDSLAVDGAPIPDPELHRTTVAQAIADHRPILLLVGTPAFCTSQICGPENEAVSYLAERYPDRAVYLHLELWKDYEGLVINEGAAEWVYRDGDASDPWLFLVGADGRVMDRWMPLFDPAEVEAALQALPSTNA